MMTTPKLTQEQIERTKSYIALSRKSGVYAQFSASDIELYISELQAARKEIERLKKAVNDMASIAFGPMSPQYMRNDILKLAREALKENQ